MPPEGVDARLSAVVHAASAADVALERPAATQLLRFLDLLQRWNATYNLTAVRDLEQMRVQHLNDCLAVIAPLRQRLAGGGRAPDTGGGGLPGVVIAALLPELDVTCVDTVGKKAALIRQAAVELGSANLHAEHARV